jgi:protein-S-isoprenylcysteine O-methyltransferase Ste14
MNSLELKIPPPVVALLSALLMWLTSRAVPALDVPFALRVGAALALACLGQAITLSGMLAFRRAKTTINPIKAHAASSLVTRGVYRFTRNPMYVGLLLTLLGWAAFLAGPLALIWLVVYVLYINRFQIVPEERVLTSLFGAEYVKYRSEVRRWL